jgi:hypothetical protein
VKSIDIDLDVHRVIENARVDFAQTENEILRYLLGVEQAPAEARPARQRKSRSSGAYSTVVGGLPIEANTLKELLRRTMLHLAKSRPGFLPALSKYETRRGRRIVARAPEQLYPNAPHLAGLAEKVNDEWWYDTNVSRGQVGTYLRVLCDIAGLAERPAIYKRSQKTPLTAADLGLEAAGEGAS